MRLRRLQYFVTVAEELSFTRAAERLHMAQPPLSHQIGLLERELGTTLFDRSRRAIRLTAAGAALLPEARRVLAEMDRIEQVVRRVGDGVVGHLAIGFVPSAANSVLPELVQGFRERHPRVGITLQEREPDALVRALHDRTLDVALLYLPVPDPDLRTHRLAIEQLVLALPEGHPAAGDGPVALADVAGEPFILPEQHDVPGLHARITGLFADAGVSPPVALGGVWLMQTVLGLVSAGTGLALVPASALNLRRTGVVLRPLSDEAEAVELAAVRLAGNRSPVLDRLLECFPAEPVCIGPARPG